MKKIEANVMKNNVRNGRASIWFAASISLISIPIQLIFNLNLWFFTIFSGIAAVIGQFVLKSKFHEAYISFYENYFEYKNSFENDIKMFTHIETMYDLKMKGIKIFYKDIVSLKQTYNKINISLKDGKNYELDFLEFGYKKIQEIKAEIVKLETKLLKEEDE
ncbi:MAG: hypothetical protein CVV25_10985 [Ignavibacteriae bacterium HGW-Ignavibacteriae-4]|jgi:hypothetical protein|nr:MAG: hypothetical protein CVV25_10985 [Ignavibacteriae bacterium HGW-Ignavibacteriae-4]